MSLVLPMSWMSVPSNTQRKGTFHQLFQRTHLHLVSSRPQFWHPRNRNLQCRKGSSFIKNLAKSFRSWNCISIFVTQIGFVPIIVISSYSIKGFISVVNTIIIILCTVNCCSCNHIFRWKSDRWINPVTFYIRVRTVVPNHCGNSVAVKYFYIPWCLWCSVIVNWIPQRNLFSMASVISKTPVAEKNINNVVFFMI